MPRLDLYCEGCGREQRDAHVPLVTLAEPRVAHGYVVTQDIVKPVCCGRPMAHHPPHVRMDAYEPMQEFVTEVQQPDGSFAPVVIDSLSKLRQVERESEQRAANGEGQRMVWRDYSQDRSNGDVHTLGESPATHITPEIRARFRKVERLTESPDDGYGPGVDDTTTSPLGPG